MGSLLLLLVITVVVITSVIDPNRYKSRIAAIVADRVGRPLVIDGNLEITWFPWLGVRMGSTHLANRPGDSQPPLIEWRSVALAARVWPLLKGELVVDRIRLQGLQLRLRRDARGQGNWEDLKLGASSPSRGGSAATGEPPQIAGVEIRDGALSYVEEDGTGLQINLSSLALEMGEWRAGQPLPVHTRFLLNSGLLPPAGIWIEADAPALKVESGAVLNLAAPKLALRIADAELKGDLTYTQGTDAAVSAHGSLAAQVPSLRKWMAQLGLNQTLPHDPSTLGQLELTAGWNYARSMLAIRPIALTLDGISLRGWVERDPLPAPGWRFELHGDRIDLGRYVNVDSTKKKAFELGMLKAINANGSIHFDQAELADTHLSDVRLRVETPEGKQ